MRGQNQQTQGINHPGLLSGTRLREREEINLASSKPGVQTRRRAKTLMQRAREEEHLDTVVEEINKHRDAFTQGRPTPVLDEMIKVIGERIIDERIPESFSVTYFDNGHSNHVQYERPLVNRQLEGLQGEMTEAFRDRARVGPLKITDRLNENLFFEGEVLSEPLETELDLALHHAAERRVDEAIRNKKPDPWLDQGLIPLLHELSQDKEFEDSDLPARKLVTRLSQLLVHREHNGLNPWNDFLSPRNVHNYSRRELSSGSRYVSKFLNVLGMDDSNERREVIGLVTRELEKDILAGIRDGSLTSRAQIEHRVQPMMGKTCTRWAMQNLDMFEASWVMRHLMSENPKGKTGYGYEFVRERAAHMTTLPRKVAERAFQAWHAKPKGGGQASPISQSSHVLFKTLRNKHFQ